MSNKLPPESSITTAMEDFKEQNIKNNLSKFEYDLYHEEDDIATKVVRVKRVSMPNKGEKWKIMVDNKIIFTIEGTKLLKKEREYLGTIEGFNFILSQAKAGIKSLNNFKIELKKSLSKKDTGSTPETLLTTTGKKTKKSK